MKKTTHKCPFCNHELNLGSLVAQARWDKKSKKEKLAEGKRLAKTRVKKSLELSPTK